MRPMIDSSIALHDNLQPACCCRPHTSFRAVKKSVRKSGFALAITLILMVLIAIIIVACLVSTRIERSTSSVYANRLRAKIQADSGLAAAIHLLKDNTRYGNYITAMPAPVPTPASIYTEIYRPTNAANTIVAK